jgi:poly(A) polymerase
VKSHCNSLRSGTVESRLRQLVMKLEFVESLTLAHPFVKGFEHVHYCLSDEEVRLVAEGGMNDAIAKRNAEEIVGKEKEGARPIHTTTFFIGLAIEAKQRAYRSLRRSVSES